MGERLKYLSAEGIPHNDVSGSRSTHKSAAIVDVYHLYGMVRTGWPGKLERTFGLALAPARGPHAVDIDSIAYVVDRDIVFSGGQRARAAKAEPYWKRWY